METKEKQQTAVSPHAKSTLIIIIAIIVFCLVVSVPLWILSLFKFDLSANSRNSIWLGAIVAIGLFAAVYFISRADKKYEVTRKLKKIKVTWKMSKSETIVFTILLIAFGILTNDYVWEYFKDLYEYDIKIIFIYLITTTILFAMLMYFRFSRFK